jgi:predicted DNA-binding protein
MRKKEFIVLRLTEDLKKRLEELAAKDMRTLSDYVRVVLTKHVEEHKGRK